MFLDIPWKLPGGWDLTSYPPDTRQTYKMYCILFVVEVDNSYSIMMRTFVLIAAQPGQQGADEGRTGQVYLYYVILMFHARGKIQCT
jgi:hypothetical protein